MTPPPYPRATVRLQLHQGFGFDAVRDLVPYLARLGVSHVYASPFLMARPGSGHGYDIIDHNHFNPEIGDEARFDAMVETLHAHGMGLLMDFVPNHMGIGAADNGWWLDVLEWGPVSPFAGFFDIDWEPAEPTLRGKVLLPLLGDHYGAVLERGELPLRFDAEEGSFSVWYYEHRFPIAVRHYPVILDEAVRADPGLREVLGRLMEDFKAIGRGGNSAREQAVKRREAADLKHRLADLYREDERVAHGIDAALAAFNGTPGEPASYDALHRLLERQAYRLAFWRVASHEINYRRFFDINDLAALRMEDSELFELAHQLIFRLIAQGKVQGLRLDHVDGLRDPARYFERLQDRAAYALLEAPNKGEETGPDQPRARLDQPLWILVEKILARHEHVRPEWTVSGTTGYDFLNLVGGLFVDPSSEAAFTDFYARFAGVEESFDDILVNSKRRIIGDVLAGEMNVIANQFNRLAKQSRVSRDYALPALRRALTNVAAYFPVYRTYVTANGCADADRRDIDWAVGRARKNAETQDVSIYQFIHDVLTTDILGEKRRGWRRGDVVQLAMKWQQFTGPVTAKAMEDTAFYRYARLAGLNEVGGEPDRFGVSVASFHQENRRRLKEHPFSLVTTATHDHKRGEDVRARMAVLSERPRDWMRRVRRWARLNAGKRKQVDDRRAPSANDEYLFYQTLVGAWPLDLSVEDAEGLSAFADRMVNYMLKAAREAKVDTAWTAVNGDYETALETFVRAALNPRRARAFLNDLTAFVDSVAPTAAVNGLSQVALRLTSPGVPDLYQGTEFWDFTLVDPDNRRPVDFAARAEALEAIDGAPADAATAGTLLESWRDGRVKQYLIHRVLDFRRRHPDLFARGSYEPLTVTGRHADRVVAFARRGDDGALLVTVAPRLVSPLMRAGAGVPLPEGWGDTAVMWPDGAGARHDLLTGARVTPDEQGRVPLSDLLATLPVAVAG